MSERPMHDVEQGLSRRIRPVADGNRRSILVRWRLIAPAVLLLLAAVVLPLPVSPKVPAATVTYSQLLSMLAAGHVAGITIEPGTAVHGRWTTSSAAGNHFTTAYPIDQVDALVARAESAGATVELRDPDAASSAGWMVISLQILLVSGLAIALFYGLRAQGIFGSSVGQRAGNSGTSFDDVAGTQGAADELHELVEFLKHPAVFARMGATVPKGVLLIGPPGTGKTLLARAVAGEAGVPFFFLSGSEVTGFIVGMGAHRIRSLFKRARKKGGVIFIDEIDALGGTRGQNRSHNEDDRTLNQLLVEMDGFSPTHGVVVIAATNRADDLDNALRRPGRFDRTVTVGLPTVDGRNAILRLHAERKRIPLDADVDLQRMARLTPGYSGAELAGLLNEAAIAAVREKSTVVAWRHFEIARDRMLLGKERVGFRARDTEWNTVAYHEAGHALAGVIGCPDDGLHKVTIQPRGQAMGVAFFSPDDDRHLHSRRYLEGQIIKGLGGRVAEEIVFGHDHITGGAESDLVHVNRVARRMIYRLGMGGANGLLVHDESAPLSGDAQSRMDAEVQALLERLYVRTRDILAAHREALDALAAALLDRETIDGEEAMKILAEHGVHFEIPASTR
ncbi:MAG: AAA family ATPase [Gemmatimonadota bacterium]